MVECTLDSMFRLLCSGDLACDKFSGAVLFAVACGLSSRIWMNLQGFQPAGRKRRSMI